VTVGSPTTETTATGIITAPAVSCDGTMSILVEFFSPFVQTTATAGNAVSLWLRQDGVSVGAIGAVINPGSAALTVPVSVSRRLTPAAGSRTYAIVASSSTGGTVGAGAGGSGANMPLFIRVTRI
jgi:hypothetical protein